MKEYVNELREKLSKDFENVSLNVMPNGEIFGECEGYVVMLKQMKELPKDFFSKPGFNTTKDLPLQYQLSVMEDFWKNMMSISDIREPKQKNYGVELPLADMLAKDIAEFIKEA